MSARVKAGHRLVKHEVLRLHGDDAGERDAALLAAAQFKRRFFARLVNVEIDELERLDHARVDLVLRQAHIARTKCHVFKYRLFKKLVLGILEYDANLLAHLYAAFFIGNVKVVDAHTAARGQQQAVEMLYER
ncbi:hypothetical protein SDC9_205706 [bioreactor metagenome]|uniref:Uncharacterized protein n=1 Tax=bioreactor metagenome TaxID=1076179 RepID=A0A645J4E7_9ZZZZ